MLKTMIRGKLMQRILSASCAINPTGTYVVPMIASSYTLAAAICSLAVTVIGMPLGRRMCILLGNACVIIGGSLQASAWSVPQMIVGRVICGFGIGFISCSIPTYQAEMALKDNQRGPDVAVTCVFLVSGAAIAYWIDFGFTRLDNQISWRFPVGLQVLFALCAGGLTLVLPDTPRWYYAKGYEAEGDETLSRLFETEIDDDRVIRMKESILASIKLEASDENQFKLLDLIWDQTNLRAGRRIRISFLMLAIQQMMGQQPRAAYNLKDGTVIFSQVGLSPFMSQLLAAIMNTIFALGSIPTIYTIERIAPLRLRHAGAAAGAFGEWIFSFITVFAGGIALQNVGWKIWLWMALSCFLAIFFVYFMCPETTGRSLEEIDYIFTQTKLKEPGLEDAVFQSSSEEKEAFNAIHVERSLSNELNPAQMK
ncbi:hypothetical protein G7Z17_g485 [Cylindrodendrum hubeiense]|uniref:Major facilitator superfamily (MFS) profile domain-containing protein n=1 Tax=Cylindrodendrum hubeiense TaxID=595255 RepID=A0A9P5LGB6_9HYPO|nr:hypothetical protein G7Z17_g485 [Cylindrodendrum hubeiense]